MNPGRHRFRVLFQRTFVRSLAREAELVQDSADMISVMPEVKLTTDNLSDPEGRPAGIWKAVDMCTLDQEAFEDVTLLPGECGWSARSDGGLKRVWATVTEAILPVADGAHRNTQELSEFLGAVLLSLVQLEEVQSTFFKLSSGQVGWQPTVSHPVILPSFTSAEINNRVLLLLALAAVAVVVSTQVISKRKAVVNTSNTQPSTAAPSAPVPASTTSVVTWNRAALIKATEAAIKKEVPLRALSPVATNTLAVNMVTVAHEEGWPLDLLLGHVLVESDCELLAKRNTSTGAMGPLQVTAIACQQVGMAYPLESGPEQLRAGIRYAQWLRRSYPECRSSVAATLQHYGMGRGTWLKWQADGCRTAPCKAASSVWREECGCGRGYSKRALAAAYRHPELHTVKWETI